MRRGCVYSNNFYHRGVARVGGAPLAGNLSLVSLTIEEAYRVTVYYRAGAVSIHNRTPAFESSPPFALLICGGERETASSKSERLR